MAKCIYVAELFYTKDGMTIHTVKGEDYDTIFDVASAMLDVAKNVGSAARGENLRFNYAIRMLREWE